MSASRLSRYLLLGAAALLPLARAARAEDTADKPAASSDNRWAGFHIGAHVGHGWGSADTVFDPLPSATQFVNLAPQTLEPQPSGSLYGLQLGYDWQYSSFVWGFEGDYSHANMDGETTVSPIQQNNGTPFPGVGNYIQTRVNTDWLATVRVKLGFTPVRNWVIYGTAGQAWGHTDFFAITSFPPVGTTRYTAALSKTNHGFTGGIGTEVGIGKHWGLKLDYLYYNLGRQDMIVDAVPFLSPYQVGYHWSNTGRTLNFGVNYKF